MKRTDDGYVAESKLNFVLVGPSGRYRRAIVRSEYRNLDLVGMDDDEEARFYSDRKIRTSFLSSLRYGRRAIRSDQIREVEEDGKLTLRKATYMLSWRGAATKEQLQIVKHLFDRRAADLQAAIANGSPQDIEIQLAPIILYCEIINERAYFRRVTLICTIGFFFFVYVFLFLSTIEKILVRL